MSAYETAVLTLTRNRPGRLRDAMQSVADQTAEGVVHVVVGDRCDYIADEQVRQSLRAEFPASIIVWNGDRVDDYLPTHLARLRGDAAAEVDARYIAMLDDDNIYEPDHVRSLLGELEFTRSPAGHSWRTLWDERGRPWAVRDSDPWVPDPRLSRVSFQRLAEYGVFEAGSNVVRDRASLGRHMGRVDTNEWLLDRQLFLEYGGPIPPSPAERRLGLTEDALMTLRLRRAGVEIACSEQATVKYFMGGYSNENVDGVALEGLE